MLPTPEDGDPHQWVEKTTMSCKPRSDLKDEPQEGYKNLYVDGSASKSEGGKNLVGFAIVNDQETLYSAALKSSYSAQAAEIVALTKT